MIAVGFLLLTAATGAVAQERVLVVYPEATERYYQSESVGRAGVETDTAAALPDSLTESLSFPDSSSGYFHQLTYWHGLFEELGYDVHVDRENALLMTGAYSFIVLPGAVCLSDDHITSLQQFVQGGGGAILTGGTATRHLDGSWRGYPLLEWALGAIPGELKGSRGEAAALQLRWGVPGTHEIPPGYYLRTTLYSDPLYVDDSDDVQVGGYWADPGYSNKFSSQIERRAGFVVREWEQGGRIAWFGDDLGGLHGDSTNIGYATQLFDELGTWLTGEAIVAATWWPDRKEAAVLIHGDIEDKFGFVQGAVDLIDEYGFSSTFNLLVQEARKHPNVVRDMVKSGGELAIHGDDHSRFAGQSLETQIERLERAREFIEAMGAKARGFRPPELAFDSTTVRALDQLGFRYVSADYISDRTAPRFIPFDSANPEGEGLVYFPKSELDDYDFFIRYQLKMPETMAEVMIDDYERIADMGGLYKWNYHSQYLEGGELLEAKDKLFEYLDNQKNLWIATALDLANWTHVRHDLDVHMDRVDEGIKVTVQNNASEAMDDIVLRILPAAGVHVEQIAPLELTGRAISDARKDAFYLTLPELAPGETFGVLFGESGSGYISARQPSKYLKWGIVGVLGLGGVFLLWNIYYFMFAKRQYKVSEQSVKFDPTGQNVPSAQQDADEERQTQDQTDEVAPTKASMKDASAEREVDEVSIADPAVFHELVESWDRTHTTADDRDDRDEQALPGSRRPSRAVSPENAAESNDFYSEAERSVLGETTNKPQRTRGKGAATAPPPPGVSSEAQRQANHGLEEPDREPIHGGRMAQEAPAPPPQPHRKAASHADERTVQQKPAGMRDYRSDRLRGLEEQPPRLNNADAFSGRDALSGKIDRGFSGAVRSPGYRYSSPDRDGFTGATYSTRRRSAEEANPAGNTQSKARHQIPDPGMPVSKRIQHTRQIEEEAEKEIEEKRRAKEAEERREEELRRREQELQRREQELRQREQENAREPEPLPNGGKKRSPIAPRDPERRTLRDFQTVEEEPDDSFAASDSLLPRSTAPLPERRNREHNEQPEPQPSRERRAKHLYSVRNDETEDRGGSWS